MYHLKIKIDGLPKTINAIGRMNFWVKVQEAKKWKELVFYATKGKIPKEPLSRAHVIFTRNSSRSADFSGLVSSFKHPEDGLISAGIITNDTMEVIGQPTYRWKKTKPKEGFIEIEVMDEEAYALLPKLKDE